MSIDNGRPPTDDQASGFAQRLAHRILQITHGRTTAFFVLFFISGHAMAFINKLSPSYVAFMGTLGGLILGHSIKDDVVAIKSNEAPKPPAAG